MIGPVSLFSSKMDPMPSHPAIAKDCQRAIAATTQELMALAVARGCHHYAPMTDGWSAPSQLNDMLHEVLGCALLHFPMPDGFDSFRCGVMILSDIGNSPAWVAEAAAHFGIERRVGYVVRIAIESDGERGYWEQLMPLFPASSGDELLPGVSRFVSESKMSAGSGGAHRVWLRTNFRQRSQAFT